MRVIHLDYETFSPQDLIEVGAYRYAADPEAAILMAGVRLDDGPELIALPPAIADMLGRPSDPGALDLLALACDPGAEDVLIYAHNAQFEIAQSTYRMEPDFGLPPPPLERWRCTQVMARRAALPQSLAECAKALKLEQQKDTRGKALIKLFSNLQTAGKLKGQRVYPWDRPAEFEEFIQYCLQDVRTEAEIHKALRPFDVKGGQLQAWLLDLRLNARGVPVNVDGLLKAQVIVDEVQTQQGEEFRQITGLNHTQRERVQEWLQARGYPSDNMQAPTVEDALADMSWATCEEVKLALQLKADLSFAAIAKIPSMLACECGDGLVRGTLKFYGAGPGRWSGQLIQPQNFKRPTFKETRAAYESLCAGHLPSAEAMQLLFGTPLDVLSSSIRHFIHDPRGSYDADYSAVEARGVCWISGQEDKLADYRKCDATGSKEHEAYTKMAMTIFNLASYRDVAGDQRWLGKQTILGCGYNMGVQKFFDQCVENAKKFGIKGLSVTWELAEKAVYTYRDEHDKVVELWGAADRAARNAIKFPGQVYRAGPFLTFVVVTVHGIPFLAMRLPSGRSIVYPYPALELEEKPAKGRQARVQITYWGKHPKKSIWVRLKTYGGKLIENAVQGSSADITAHGASVAIEREFDVYTLIHDQALAIYDGRPASDFAAALTSQPPWANGFPIKADCKIVPYYLK